MGFLPQFADFNGDGAEDLITGSYYGDQKQRQLQDGSPRYDENGDYWGDVFIFYGNKDGTYQPRQVLTHALMHPTPVPIDWDKDGDFDLVTVTWGTGKAMGEDGYEGSISWMENIGTREKAEFDYPTPLVKDGSYASVLPYDWNRDGLVDLVASGYTEGSIFWFENTGSKQEAQFGKPVTLVKGETHMEKWDVKVSKATPWGMSLQLHLVDWDGDGVLDILAGDNASFNKANPSLNDSDRKAMAEAKARMDAFVQAIHKGERPEYPTQSEDVRLMNRGKFIEGHGRVWVFRGQAGGSDSR